VLPWRLQVQDDGCGMTAAAVRELATVAFATTKRQAGAPAGTESDARPCPGDGCHTFGRYGIGLKAVVAAAAAWTGERHSLEIMTTVAGQPAVFHAHVGLESTSEGGEWAAGGTMDDGWPTAGGRDERGAAVLERALMPKPDQRASGTVVVTQLPGTCAGSLNRLLVYVARLQQAVANNGIDVTLSIRGVTPQPMPARTFAGMKAALAAGTARSAAAGAGASSSGSVWCVACAEHHDGRGGVDMVAGAADAIAPSDVLASPFGDDTRHATEPAAGDMEAGRREGGPSSAAVAAAGVWYDCVALQATCEDDSGAVKVSVLLVPVGPSGVHAVIASEKANCIAAVLHVGRAVRGVPLLPPATDDAVVPCALLHAVATFPWHTVGMRTGPPGAGTAPSRTWLPATARGLAAVAAQPYMPPMDWPVAANIDMHTAGLLSSAQPEYPYVPWRAVQVNVDLLRPTAFADLAKTAIRACAHLERSIHDSMHRCLAAIRQCVLESAAAAVSVEADEDEVCPDPVLDPLQSAAERQDAAVYNAFVPALASALASVATAATNGPSHLTAIAHAMGCPVTASSLPSLMEQRLRTSIVNMAATASELEGGIPHSAHRTLLAGPATLTTTGGEAPLSYDTRCALAPPSPQRAPGITAVTTHHIPPPPPSDTALAAPAADAIPADDFEALYSMLACADRAGGRERSVGAPGSADEPSRADTSDAWAWGGEDGDGEWESGVDGCAVQEGARQSQPQTNVDSDWGWAL